MILAATLACSVLEGEDPKEFLKRVAYGLKPHFEVGEEVISATGDTRDIIEACLQALKRMDKARFSAEISDHDVFQYTSLGEIENDFDPEYYLYEHLYNVLQKYCPPMTYFGSYEADGSVGCWPIDGDAISQMVDTDELFYIDESVNPEQADTVRRGDFSDIEPPYVMIEDPFTHKELWDKQHKRLVWKW